jgi:hypothetical protein
LAVLRYTHKRVGPGGPYFTERDQRFLEQVVADIIGPKLVALRSSESNARVHLCQRLSNSISVQQHSPRHPEPQSSTCSTTWTRTGRCSSTKSSVDRFVGVPRRSIS